MSTTIRPEIGAEIASPALQLVSIVWKHSPHRSRQQFYHAMESAVTFAIKTGLRWDLGDYTQMLSEFVFGRGYGAAWVYQKSPEHWYLTAVIAGNTSFCQAFEHANGFKPYFGRNVRMRFNYSGSYEAKRSRLAVGMTFDWDGCRPAVTSITPEHIVACTYNTTGGLDRKFKITRASLGEFERKIEATR